MATRKRDYRAEYRRRVARGKAKGLSRGQATGHPRKGELSAAAVRKFNFTVKSRGLRGKLKAGATVKDLNRFAKADARYVFGKVPKRGFDDGSAPEYQLRLEQLASRRGAFDWKSEDLFVKAMQALGMNERQAYSLWFSPGGASV